MNIYLVPYTFFRHIVVALNTGAAALLFWYFLQVVVVGLGPTFYGLGIYWNQAAEGTIFLAGTAGVIAFTHILAEGALRRRRLLWRVMYAGLAAAISFLSTIATYLTFRMLVPYMTTEINQKLANDSSLTTLRWTLAMWALAGVMSGVGPYLTRRIQRFSARSFGFAVDGSMRPRALKWSARLTRLFLHAGGGMASATFGASIWHFLGQYRAWGGDLYLASAYGVFVWGLMHGLLTWGFPDDLYAGWIRILSPERYGLRIPVDRTDGQPAERFIGHFPRGLDMYMPAEHGVAELHTSFVVDDSQNYAVRGLSIRPTLVRRFLERINLAYDPHRPAPLETRLNMEDRVVMGEGPNASEVEFIRLPKEEL